jgi:replicative DNA helicase
MNELQQWNEQDVIGSMLINGDMRDALIKGLATTDLMFEIHRVIYKLMIANQQFGRLYQDKLLESSNTYVNDEILSIMDRCITTNTEVKCNWLLEQSEKRWI